MNGWIDCLLKRGSRVGKLVSEKKTKSVCTRMYQAMMMNVGVVGRKEFGILTNLQRGRNSNLNNRS